MRIDGVPDYEMERFHWNNGHGKGAIGLRHKPSGITVTRECPSDVPVLRLEEELWVELKVKLEAAGVIGKT
jgi:hypothetical protein